MKTLYGFRSRSRAALSGRGRRLRPAPEGRCAPTRARARRAGADSRRREAPPADTGGRAQMLHDPVKLRSSPTSTRSTSPTRSRASPASASTPSASAARSRRLPRDPALDPVRRRPALPPVITELSEEERGIILLTGTTGSGKSTTLAAMLDHINSTMSKHIVTIEDPIEFLHVDKRRSSTSARSGWTRCPSSARCAASCARTRT